MAAAGAEERRGAAGPERAHSSAPGPGPLSSLLSRLPLAPAPAPRRRTASQCKPEPPLLRTSKRTIYTAGRPPWYSETGAPVDEAFVIGERWDGAGEGMEPDQQGDGAESGPWKGWRPDRGRGRAAVRNRGTRPRGRGWDRAGAGAGSGSGPVTDPGRGGAPAAPRRPVRRQRLRQDHGGDADHRGAGRALGRAALHGLLLQGAGRGPGSAELGRHSGSSVPLGAAGDRAAGIGCGGCRDPAQRSAVPVLGLRGSGAALSRAGVPVDAGIRHGPEQCRCLQVLDEGQQALAARSDYNFDHPDAFDFELLVNVLRKLKKGKSVKVPVYDFTTHSRRREWKTVYGANVIVFEGILAFANKELLKLLDMKVFVDTDSDIRLVRRLQRDIMERGRDVAGVIKQYNKFVKPAFEQYIEPTVQVADIVVPRGGENSVALDLIVQHVHSQLEKREITVRAALASAHQGQPLPKTLSVLESTPQVRGMHTIIRNKDTTRDEFIFYSKRLMRLLIEHALSFLPLKITGVSILRAGETMEQALTAVCKDIRLGKILIQTNLDTGEPELHYLRLPKEISEDYVILMDSTVSTGAAAMMAVRVLLDHDVQEDRIFLLSLLMAEMGVHSVAYAFPRVRIITTAVDKRVNEEFHIIPGIGNFGDRYFGTDGPSAWCDSDIVDC
uniref:uridine/cytidine kinase n=1 Tax=Junco hyemalis TaxID=40217 RepID=A0A8C5J5Y2_JUNHY